MLQTAPSQFQLSREHIAWEIAAMEERLSTQQASQPDVFRSDPADFLPYDTPPEYAGKVASLPVPVISPDHPRPRRPQHPTPPAQSPAANKPVRLKYDGAPSPWPNIERRPAGNRHPDGTPKLRAFVPAGHHEALTLDLETGSKTRKPATPSPAQAPQRRPVPRNDGDKYSGIRRMAEHRVRRFIGNTVRRVGYLALISADAVAANSLIHQAYQHYTH